MVTCEIKHWNNFEIISEFYFTFHYVTLWMRTAHPSHPSSRWMNPPFLCRPLKQRESTGLGGGTSDERRSYDRSAEGAEWIKVWGGVSLPRRLGVRGSVVSSSSGVRSPGQKRIYGIFLFHRTLLVDSKMRFFAQIMRKINIHVFLWRLWFKCL